MAAGLATVVGIVLVVAGFKVWESSRTPGSLPGPLMTVIGVVLCLPLVLLLVVIVSLMSVFLLVENELADTLDV
jgi:uncharacterized membrane protein YccC